MKAPSISIGLPVYNGARYLAATIESLLAQTFSDFEIIISDNASTDGTEAICRAFAHSDQRVQYVRSESNRGAAWNFNNTQMLARGEYFKWAAHDDLYHPEFLAVCRRQLEMEPGCVLSFCNTTFIDASGNSIGAYRHPIDLGANDLPSRFRDIISAQHIVVEIFGLMRTRTLNRSPLIGSYYGSDRVLLAWLALRGTFSISPQRLFLHREHPGRSSNVSSAAAYTTWFDTSKRDPIVLPTWRLASEYANVVLRSGHTVRTKAVLLREVARVAYWQRNALLSEVVHASVRTTQATLNPFSRRSA